MRLKVFKLRNGKLEFAGIREVREGDAILDSETSMSEVNLRESANSEDIHLKNLSGLIGQAKSDYKAGLAKLGIPDPEVRASLKASFKRTFLQQGMDDATADRAADIAVGGR
ncbi:MAG: hypothetical protein AB1597_09475 [Chloroflexota bacterium]